MPRWSQCWKSCLQNKESWKRSNQTTDPSLQVTSLQSSQRTGTLVHLHQGTPGAMDKQNQQSRLLGSIARFVSIQEYPSWFTSMITCWDALSTCSTYDCATKDQAQGPPCSSWTWKVRGTCHPECSQPWPYRLPQESPTLCRTIRVYNQQWQDTVAPCHCCTYSQSWLIHHQSHW